MKLHFKRDVEQYLSQQKGKDTEGSGKQPHKKKKANPKKGRKPVGAK